MTSSNSCGYKVSYSRTFRMPLFAPLQEAGESSILQQSPEDITCVHSRQNSCQSPPQPPHQAPRTGTFPWELVRLSCWKRNSGYDLCGKAALWEVPGIEQRPLHNLCWSYRGLWHREQRGCLEDDGQVPVWLPRQVHCHHTSCFMTA